MIVFREPAEVPEGFGPAVVVIGKFDGVHAGHRTVLERARVDAAATGAEVVAVTFDRNPLSLLRPELCPESLVGATQKIQLLAETGIDATLLLRADMVFQSKSRVIGDHQNVVDFPAFAPYEFIPSKQLVNGRIALRDVDIGGAKWEFALWGKNILNNRKPIAVNEQGEDAAGNPAVVRERTYLTPLAWQAPRSVRFMVQYDF